MATVRRGHPSSRPAQGALSRLAQTATGPTSFIVVEEKDGFTVQGVDANSDPVHLFDTVTLGVTSSDPSVIVPQAPNVDYFKVVPLKPGTANLSVVVTYKNGKAGPFTITIPVTVVGQLGIELQVIPGTITIA